MNISVIIVISQMILQKIILRRFVDLGKLI